MVGRIYTQSLEDLEKEEALGINLPVNETDLFFKSSALTSAYVVNDGEEQFIRITVDGSDYPIIYDDVIYNKIKSILADA